MKKIAIYLITGLLLVSVTAKAENDDKDKKNTSAPVAVATIAGQVIDQETGEALTGVLVKINNTGQETYTDFDGNFTFEGVQPGEYEIVTKLISYQVHIDKKVKVEKAAKNSVKVSMKKK